MKKNKNIMIVNDKIYFYNSQMKNTCFVSQMYREIIADKQSLWKQLWFFLPLVAVNRLR